MVICGVGVPPSAFVRTASEGSDQSLGVSSFFARTCTWYSVSAVSPVIVAVTPAPSCVKSFQPPLVPWRYRTS